MTHDDHHIIHNIHTFYAYYIANREKAAAAAVPLPPPKAEEYQTEFFSPMRACPSQNCTKTQHTIYTLVPHFYILFYGYVFLSNREEQVGIYSLPIAMPYTIKQRSLVRWWWYDDNTQKTLQFFSLPFSYLPISPFQQPPSRNSRAESSERRECRSVLSCPNFTNLFFLCKQSCCCFTSTSHISTLYYFIKKPLIIIINIQLIRCSKQ